MRIVFGLGSVSATSIPAEWASLLAKRGFNISVVPLRASDVSAADFIPRMWKAVRMMRPHVVHVHHTLPSLSIPVLKRSSIPFKTVLTVHRLMSDMKPVAAWGHRVGGLSADAVVANSMATMQSLPLSFHSASRRCCTIYNGVDFSMIDAYADHSARTGGPLRLLSVGRLIPEKGMEILLRAVDRVRKEKGIPMTLTIMGGGVEEARLRSLVLSLQLTDVVKLTGVVSREEVYRQMWRSDVFVLSSRTEGFCNAVVEAMATGLPVVVNSVGALPEVVGSAGWMSSGTGVREFADALTRAMLANPEERKAVGERARKRSRKLFSVDSTLDQYEELYRELTGAAIEI